MNCAKYYLPVIVLGMLCGGAPVAEAQEGIYFQSEWLLWTRGTDTDTTYLTGPDSLSADDEGFSPQSGYRFTLGGGLGRFSLEASFSEIPDWDANNLRVLANPVAFDDPTNVFIAPANGLGFTNGLTDAALIAPEDTEIEHLEGGAMAITNYSSRLRNFELNLSSPRSNNGAYAGVGWRHLELDENAGFLMIGNFQALDVDDGVLPGGAPNEPNDALAGGSLGSVGFTAINAGDFLGYDPTAMPPVITTLGAGFQGLATNDLDGIQAVFGGRYQPFELLILEGFLKLGGYHNRVRGTVVETIFGVENSDAIYQRRFVDARTVASFVGTIGARFIIPVTAYINLGAGYEALWAANLALGPDQHQGIATDLLGVTSYNVRTNGNLIAHGGNLFFEITY